MIFIDFSVCFLVNSTAAVPRAPPIPPPRKSAAPPPAPPRHGRRSVAVPGAFGAGGWKGGRWGQNPWKILLRVGLYIYVVSDNRLKSEIAPLKIRIRVCRPAFRQSQELWELIHVTFLKGIPNANSGEEGWRNGGFQSHGGVPPNHPSHGWP